MGDERKRLLYHNKLKNILVEVDAHSTVPLTHVKAVEKMTRVEEIWRKFEVLQETLEDTAKDNAALAVQVAAGEDVEITFSDVRGKLRNLIEMLAPKPAAATSSSTAPTRGTIKLPTISLPTFEGNFSDWVSFKDLFTAAVASNKDLTNAQKLQYLKTSTKGEPANLIKCLTTTDANYNEAWSILDNRYDNKREIVHSLINKLVDYRPVKTESARELQALIDNTMECIRSLKVQGCPTDHWDDILVVIIAKKLDSDTRREWAKKHNGNSLPKFSELETFLESHIRGLYAAGSSFPQSDRRGERQVKVHHVETTTGQCPTCDSSHLLQECKDFLDMRPSERSALVKKLRLCFNCLRRDHMIRNCSSTRKCKKCGSKHHSLLHEEQRKPVPGGGTDKSTEVQKPEGTVKMHHTSVDPGTVIMTAVVNVADRHGRMFGCRVVLDPGSEGDFMSEACLSRLGLPRKGRKLQVIGVGGADAGTTRGEVATSLHSRMDFSKLDVSLLVVTKITGKLPSASCVNGRWGHLNGLELADPNWHRPGTIDILLGIRYFHKVLLSERRIGAADGEPVAWKTIFGWTISGECPEQSRTSVISYHIKVDTTDSQLRKFWEVEEPPKKRILTEEEKFCEQHFQRTYKRLENGKFMVSVPFNEKLSSLGRSRDIAIKRLYQVERRLSRNENLRKQYTDFMREYESLGHMTRVPDKDVVEKVGVTNYLCHHFVQNDSSTTTKLRVVFDGSATTTSGVSLNDTMYIGATMQDDLYELLLRFRLHAVVLKADITKMFRQFELGPADANLHRIVWRENPNDKILDYRLTTVTYGTASAPYLATRCLHQLGLDTANSFPLASEALLTSTYDDDTLFGQPTVEAALLCYEQLTEAVKTAGLELRKWTSNDKAVMAAIPEDLRDTNPLSFSEESLVKALGVQWDPNTDEFQFKMIGFKEGTVSKRELLSEIARIFDPLGLIACVTVRGKLLMQDSWKVAIEWDDKVPESVENRWQEMKQDLELLPQLRIPRRITKGEPERLELFGFGDASETAFGGNVYLRSIYPNGTVVVRFVTSKTRVAPVRQITLPRLELNAAVCVAELITYCKESLKLEADLHLYSDSTITLRWIQGTPRKWKTYVANRVATIQELTPVGAWKHVAGEENPADLASRGCTVAELINSQLWWNGPKWLSQPVLPTFAEPQQQCEVDMEERKTDVNVHILKVMENALLLKFSSLTRLKRYTAYYLRYMQYKVTGECQTGPLTPTELETALLVWVRKVQQQHFQQELASIRKDGKVQRTSRMRDLFPFIDNKGILRLSGRLKNAKLPEKVKHQCILPEGSHLTDLLVSHYHHSTFHGGFTLTWSSLQAEYWVLGGRNKVRFFVRSCVRCRRFRAKVAEQLMGNLPSARVTPSRCFLHTRVDYAGPFVFKNPIGRAPKTYKGYLCLFVCLATKAIHLEAVSSLSTEAFLAALRRFVGRRGLCSHIYSDCGTNFVGAEKELRSLMMDKKRKDVVAKELGDKGITWHFNPPSAPHRGGLWEAGVKSAKHHLRRVIGSAALTYEDFNTVIVQIEGILNSRPLYTRSSDPNDLEPLTPGHFLIGAPLNSVPESELLDIPTNRLSRYQHLQQRLQHFWKRWSMEYLNTLQQRNKWMWDRENVKEGDLVLVVEETSPGEWRMGRISKVFPSDTVRRVEIKTATSNFERPITKVVPLLSEDRGSEN